MAAAIVYGITGQKVEKQESTPDKDAEAENAETKTSDDKTIYRVQVGAYAVKANADKMLAKLKSDGYDGFIVEGTL